MSGLRWTMLALVFAAGGAAGAQAPGGDVPAEALRGDESFAGQPAVDDIFSIDEAPLSPWQPSADLLLRGDRVSGLPAGREDLERVLARLRVGMTYASDGGLRAGAGVLAAAAGSANADSVRNNDNQKADTLALDSVWIGGDGEQSSWRAGKRGIGMDFSPLLWDQDHRPVGIEGRTGAAFGGGHRWSLAAGAHVLEHPLGGSARFAAVQAGVSLFEGRRSGAEVLLAWVGFDRLHGLARAGLARGNTLAAGDYSNDYRLLDLQLLWRHRFERAPLQLRLDLVRNLGADADRDGARASIVYGDRWQPGGWEFGFAWQRAQADAVLAAASADDWWFRAGARGHMPWIGVALGRHWSARAAAFLERRDGLDVRTDRLLLDLEGRW